MGTGCFHRGIGETPGTRQPRRVLQCIPRRTHSGFLSTHIGLRIHEDAARGFACDWDAVPQSVWRDTALLYVCSPGNPTGAVMPLAEWAQLFELSDRYGFVIASDECYSEIYRAEAPYGVLRACADLHDGEGDPYSHVLAVNSLSKRSSAPVASVTPSV